MNLIDSLRQRSREEYQALLQEQTTKVRIWLQEHGELALVVGLLSGIVMVEAFKLVVFLAVLAVVVGVGIWLIALPQDQMPLKATPQPASDPQPEPQSDASAPDDKEPPVH